MTLNPELEFDRLFAADADIADEGEDVAVHSNAEADEEEQVQIPDELPILPLRGVVVYPQTAVPLTVGQPRSIRLVDEVVGGDKLVGLVAAVNPELESPG